MSAFESDAVRGVIAIITTLIITVILVIHIRNYYQDFHTEERRCVKHRRSPPDKEPFTYRTVAKITLLGVFCGAIAIYAYLFLVFGATQSTCRGFNVTRIVFFVLTKLCIYYVYLLRLHMVYYGTEYETRIRHLYGFCGFISILASFLGLSLLYLAIIVSIPYVDGDEENIDDKWAFDDDLCILFSATWYTGAYAVFDVLLNVLYCYKFIRPIRSIIRKVQGSSRSLEEKSKISIKMLAVGTKVAILATVQCLSTIVILVSSTGAFGFFIDILSIDVLINIICMVLMTPYYPDRRYYNRLCLCCLFCCDRNGYSTGMGRPDKVLPASPTTETDEEDDRTMKTKDYTVTNIDALEKDANQNPNNNDQIESTSGAGSQPQESGKTLNKSVDTMSQVGAAAREIAPLKSTETGHNETNLAQSMQDK